MIQNLLEKSKWHEKHPWRTIPVSQCEWDAAANHLNTRFELDGVEYVMLRSLNALDFIPCDKHVIVSKEEFLESVGECKTVKIKWGDRPKAQYWRGDDIVGYYYPDTDEYVKVEAPKFGAAELSHDIFRGNELSL